MSRGLTMIELLLALSLLSVLMLAIASWTQTTARASTSLAEPLKWRSAAEAVLQLVHDDLACGDFDPRNRNEHGKPDQSRNRIAVAVDALSIATRFSDRGAVIHRFERDALLKRLSLTENDPRGKQTKWLLLEQVDRWDCALDEQEKSLTVSISSMDGQMLTRRYSIR